MFVTINAGGKADNFDSKRPLSRQQFLQFLVRLAAARRVKTTSDSFSESLSESVHWLLSERIGRYHAAIIGVMGDTNAFRTEHCYLEEVDCALRQYEPSLRALFQEESVVSCCGMSESSEQIVVNGK